MNIILCILLGLIQLVSGCYGFENKPFDYFILIGCPIWFFNAYCFYKMNKQVKEL